MVCTNKHDEKRKDYFQYNQYPRTDYNKNKLDLKNQKYGYKESDEYVSKNLGDNVFKSNIRYNGWKWSYCHYE